MLSDFADVLCYVKYCIYLYIKNMKYENFPLYQEADGFFQIVTCACAVICKLYLSIKTMKCRIEKIIVFEDVSLVEFMYLVFVACQVDRVIVGDAGLCWISLFLRLPSYSRQNANIDHYRQCRRN